MASILMITAIPLVSLFGLVSDKIEKRSFYGYWL